MKITGQIDFQHAGALSRALKAGKISRERFSLEIGLRDAFQAVCTAWKVEVESRGASFIFSEDVRKQASAVAEWLVNPNGSPFLMLCGLCGNGKTSLALALRRLIEYLTEKELGYRRGKYVRVATAKEIADPMKSGAYGHQRDSSSQPRIAFANEEMLIVDDLGEEPRDVMVYGMVHTPLIDLISERYASRRFTIFTTNLDTDQIREKYGARIYDRLKECCTSIVFSNDSYRGRT